MAANPTAQVFVEPDDGADVLLGELNGATRSIDVVMYLLLDRPVIGALERAERRGVQVRVLLERHPFGEGSGNADTYQRLQRAGVAVRWTDPKFKLTHEKAMVIDEREALILTLNLTASAFSRNREFGAIDRSPEDVAEVEALFNADWNHTGYTPGQADLAVSPNNSRARLLGIIGQATRDLAVESEEVQDDGIEAGIVAAGKRSVRVRLVLSPPESGPDANAKGIAKLKSGGVQVHFMRKPYVHAKMFLADGQVAFVGSQNISTLSLDANRELGLFVNEPRSLQRLAATFEQDWNSKG